MQHCSFCFCSLYIESSSYEFIVLSKELIAKNSQNNTQSILHLSALHYISSISVVEVKRMIRNDSISLIMLRLNHRPFLISKYKHLPRHESRVPFRDSVWEYQTLLRFVLIKISKSQIIVKTCNVRMNCILSINFASHFEAFLVNSNGFFDFYCSW